MAYQRKDAFYRRAKSEGYRSRAAYKLIELNRRHRLMRPGDRILDLGGWPGGWTQVAAECVGERGRVVAVDLVPMQALPQPWVHLFCADLRDENVRQKIAEALQGKADVVLSDMAPKLTGIRDRDEAQATELATLALEVARHFLRPGGRFLVKLFDSSETESVMREIRSHFATVTSTRPESTRKGSAELYAVASGFRAPAPDSD